MKALADESNIMGEVKVKYGRGVDYVGLVPSKPVSTIIHKDLNYEDLKVVLPDDFPTIVDSPIEKGEKVGKAKLVYEDVEIAQVELVAYQTVKRNYLWAMFNWVEAIAMSKVFIVVVVLIVIVLVILYFGTKNQRDRKKRKKNKIEIVKDYSKLSK